ncbi:PASTA domain-containing protein [Micromonospora echinofusca]|uniref:PASTA domain-containing protein n=1 Tax=Micromonospora echinofusca TaxID=47858 RepID=A0ABS3W044_MICEH|nr:PASTA domain-containing protein [Micromonospora echinofusca]MBO4210181.1 PASTA domain-containing protein [Micromonospora echinofusca]
MAEPYPGAPPPVARRSWLLRLAGLTAVVCTAGAVAVNRRADQQEQSGPTPTVAGTATPGAQASGTAAGPTPGDPATTPGTPSPAAGTVGGPVTVPDLTGRRLTEAKAALVSLRLGTPQVVDATGQGRLVLDDRNWVVVTQDPPAGTGAGPDLLVTLRVRKPTDGTGSGTVTVGVVPDVVCKDLQSAQDAMQAARFFNLRSTDATGQGRMQLLDRDWVVVGQSVRAGTSPELTTRITLSVVRFGEPTGGSGCAS